MDCSYFNSLFLLAFKRELICSAMDSGTSSPTRCRFSGLDVAVVGRPFLLFARCVVVVGLVVFLVVVSVGS